MTGSDQTSPPPPPNPAVITGPLVEQSVTLATDPDTVWRLLTTPAGITAWYTIGGGAELEPVVGAPVRLWWEPGSRFLGRVVKAEAPRRFDYRLAHGVNVSPQQAPSTLVQFLVTEAPDDPSHTVVAVRESGFDTVDDPKEAFTASSLAWIGALGLLQQVVTRLTESSGETAPGPANR